MQQSNQFKLRNDREPIVVIGGGIAGVTCAKTLSIDQDDQQVILVSASPLVKTIANLRTLGRSMDVFDVIEQRSNQIQSSNLKVINERVIKLNADHHEIILEDGSSLKYSKLCICTGAIPRTIQVDSDDCHVRNYIKYIRDTDTAKDFTNMLQGSKRILVAGNGGIATEVVYAVENVEIIWAFRDKTFGSVFFDAGAAKFFSEFLNDHGHKDEPGHISKRLRYGQTENNHSKTKFGVALGPDWSRELVLKGNSSKKVSLETEVEIVQVISNCNSIPEDKRKNVDFEPGQTWNIYVELSNGKIIGCDMMIVAFGVIPNIEPFLNANHFTIDNEDGGLMVDHEMRTSVCDVYAAGDVCSVAWCRTKSPHWFQMRLWTQARQMGYYAAKCIQAHINHQTTTSPVNLYFNFEVFTHVTRFFGFRVILLGLFDGQNMNSGDDNMKILYKIIPGKEYVKVILQDGRMKGAVLIGDSNLEETFEFLIYNQIDLTRFGDDLLEDVVDVEDFFD